MISVLLAAMLPALHWLGDVESATRLREVGVERVMVAAENVRAWSELGFQAESAQTLREYTAVSAPSVTRERSAAGATSIPWVEANGWRFLQGTERVWYRDVPRGRAALAAAEAFSYGVDAALDIDPEDLAEFGRMIRFLQGVDAGDETVLADIGFVDDGSAEAQEAMKLLERRNLLFRKVMRPDSRLDLHVELGAEGYSREDAANPHEFAGEVRRRLSDDRRLLRIYGSNVVLGHVTEAGGATRVHLLNHGPRGVVDGLRVRVEGEFTSAKMASFDTEDSEVADIRVREGGTEFTVPRLVAYAVIALN